MWDAPSKFPVPQHKYKLKPIYPFFFFFLFYQLPAFTAEIFVVSCQEEIILLWTTKYYSFIPVLKTVLFSLHNLSNFFQVGLSFPFQHCTLLLPLLPAPYQPYNSVNLYLL